MVNAIVYDGGEEQRSELKGSSSMLEEEGVSTPQ
jgi:hypothetical protein